eukprot:ANDGO_00684.mRNA.1 putative formate transporter
MGLKNAADTWRIVQQLGFEKARVDWRRTLVLSMSAGMYVAFACLAATSISYALPGVKATDPGIPKLVFSFIFPLGLNIIVQTQSMLFTGQSMMLGAALLYYKNRKTFRLLLKNWSLVYIGNLVGCVLVSYLFGYLSDLYAEDYYKVSLRATAERKVNAGAAVNLLRGIPANVLVCISLFCGFAAEDAAGRILAMWGPIFMFAAFGFEHSVANMVFLTLGLLFGADISIWDAVLQNLLPSTLGNIIGGVCLVAAPMWFCFTVAPPLKKHIPANPMPGSVAVALLHAPRPEIINLSQEPVVQFAKRYLSKEGGIVDAWVHANVIRDPGGNPCRVVSQVYKYDPALNVVDESVDPGMIIAGLTPTGQITRIEFVDGTFCKMLEYKGDEQHDLIGKTVDEITLKEDARVAEHAFGRLLHIPSPLHGLSHSLSHASASGGSNAFHDDAVPHQDIHGAQDFHDSLSLFHGHTNSDCQHDSVLVSIPSPPTSQASNSSTAPTKK